MPKGGARVNSGPPPDPMAIRRDRPRDIDGWTELPADGRKGDPPAWPLKAPADTERAERELAVWASVWRTPAAAVWESLGWQHDVAVYVRLLVRGEAGDNMRALSEARQWSDRLGLNPAAMLRNRWRVARPAASDEQPAATGTDGTPAKRRAHRGGGSRSRLTVISDASAE